MATRCNIIIKRGEQKILIYRHCDGYPSETGRDLLKICGKAGYDLFEIIQAFAESGHYELSRVKHGDAEYEYTIDLDKKDITCYSINREIYIKSDMFDSSERIIYGGLNQN